jgi:hypothetical protein
MDDFMKFLSEMMLSRLNGGNENLEKRFIRELTGSESDDIRSMQAGLKHATDQMRKAQEEIELIHARRKLFWAGIKRKTPALADIRHLCVDDKAENLLEVIHMDDKEEKDGSDIDG